AGNVAVAAVTVAPVAVPIIGLVFLGLEHAMDFVVHHARDIVALGHLVEGRDDVEQTAHGAPLYWSMIFSENRYPLFGIMLGRCAERDCAQCQGRRHARASLRMLSKPPKRTAGSSRNAKPACAIS